MQKKKKAVKKKGLIGRYVIIRANSAGVHAGILEARKGDRVTIRDSRRLWRWWSRFSLSELANEGVRADKILECRFSAPTSESVELRDWCEIRPCSKVSEKSIRGVANANS